MIYRKMICAMNFFFVTWIGLSELKSVRKKNEEESKFLNIFVHQHFKINKKIKKSEMYDCEKNAFKQKHPNKKILVHI